MSKGRKKQSEEKKQVAESHSNMAGMLKLSELEFKVN